GIIVPPLRLTPEIERFLLANVRTPDARRADLAAQRAAVERGADGLRALAARYGSAAVRAAACDLLDYAERRAREALGRLGTVDVVASDWLEGDGVDDADLEIRVRVEIRDGAFHVDFTGSAPAARGNVNCPLAVARSAALFVVRTLLPEDVPTNGGVQRAVSVTAPVGCLVNARFPSAVAAGNVETSQRIVDTLFLALGAGGLPVPAQGQGTMNNVTRRAGRITRRSGVVRERAKAPQDRPACTSACRTRGTPRSRWWRWSIPYGLSLTACDGGVVAWGSGGGGTGWCGSWRRSRRWKRGSSRSGGGAGRVEPRAVAMALRAPQC
ncbi:MAG: hypothetical protein DMD67_04965, partial [Gemmatimonadetes bacterium]